MNQINSARASFYRFLSDLFAREISTKRMEELTCSQARPFWQQLISEAELSADAGLLWDKLTAIETASHDEGERALLELAADFCGLFLVSGKGSVSPYAGSYLNDDSDMAVFGEWHQQMLGFLQQAGLSVDSDFPEPADHLAVILAYQAELCLKAPSQAQLTFLEECILSWLPDFTDRIGECDQQGFYAALARLTQAFVRSDAQWLRLEN
ncbi:molecular chaperone TorD [Vibrio sp.]|uniref:molecular chaperone TorD n=1 Tax=Vibrio sp. TaxID=678 RepID=UPI003D0F9A21